MLIKQKILFTKEECELIVNLSKINQQDWKSKDRKYNSFTLNYNTDTDWLFGKLKSFFELDTQIEIIKLKSQIHFHKFTKGDWFGKHNDIRDNRIYAVGVLLNDNFEGGDFKLYNPEEQILDKIVGNAYIFDVRIEHEITTILNGERYSLLWFLQNDNIKLLKNKLI